jgi:hypothetical protein
MLACVVIAIKTTGESPWYGVAAGLGAAVILAAATLAAAWRQRVADSARLDKQLQHDRAIRVQELKASGDRLDEQLRHDRELRDRDHLREALGGVLDRILDFAPLTRLQRAVEEGSELSEDDEAARVRAHNEALRASLDVQTQGKRITVEAMRLAAVVGLKDPLVKNLDPIAQAMKDMVEAVEQWTEGKLSDEECQAKLAELVHKIGFFGGWLSYGAYVAIGVVVRRPSAESEAPENEG